MVSSIPQANISKKIKTKHLWFLLACLILLVFFLSHDAFGSHTLFISEVMSSNRCNIRDEDGDYSDWIEIYNSGTNTIDLTGYWLSDDPTNPLKWEFPAVTIEPGQYLLIFASGKDRKDPQGPYLHTNFALSAAGETIVFCSPDVKTIDSVEIGPLFSNISLGRSSSKRDKWLYYFAPTPGAANYSQGYEQIEQTPAENIEIIINEFITANETSVIDPDGDLVDWIEFYNAGNTAQNLQGFWLSDKADNPFKWQFPEVTLEPGEYLLVYASGKNITSNKNNLHTNFQLNDTKDQLVFSDPEGRLIEKINIEGMIRNVSFGRNPENLQEWLYYPAPTPLKFNNTQGFTKLSGKELPTSYQLHLNEAQSQNIGVICDEDGDFSDWIEIYNAGETEINLEGFYLSDQPENPFRWEFPSIIIEPQGHLVVFASGKDRKGNNDYLHTNFSLETTGETILLTAPTGEVLDSLDTGKQEAGLSAGRYPDGGSERFFFSTTTPGAKNSPAHYTGRAPEPLFSQEGGFYDQAITISLNSPIPNAAIHYTLDGGEPTTASPRYERPLVIDKTTVVRAKVFADGMLPSKTVNKSFFINEDTELTVISIFINPEDLWDPHKGIYVLGNNAAKEFPHLGANFWQDWEKPIHLQLFEPNRRLGLSIDAGMRIGGQYSRAMPQKAFNIFARNQYGYNVMEYPFFPDKDLTTFRAITLRQSGQDGNLSRIRDCLMTSLLNETTLDYQAYRPAVVFINGEYWGHYNIRERINEYFLAYNHGINPQQIDLLQGNTMVQAGDAEHYIAMREFIATNDMSKKENYAYIQTQMDIQNFMDYWIAQIYFANTDSANIRFWREKNENGKWRWIVYDTDWGFLNVDHNTLAYVTNPAGTGVGRHLSTVLLVNLLKNQEFKAEFINRFAYHLNHTFAKERVINRINELAAAIESEMPDHFKRWGGSMSAWYYQVQKLRDFAEKRPAIVVKHIQQKFNLTDAQMEIFNDW